MPYLRNSAYQQEQETSVMLDEHKIISDQIIGIIRQVTGQTNTTLPLHEPCIGEAEKKFVISALDSGYVSYLGKYVAEFEQQLSMLTGIKHTVATVNGTTALHLALRVLDIKANDEVLVPSLTFVATANAISYLDAYPHFVDIDENSLGVDTDKLADYLSQIAQRRDNAVFNEQTGRKISALCVMHTFGHPTNLDSCRALCDEYQLYLIEDAAEALGSFYKNKHVGNHADIAMFSFNGNKIITTGGGGALVTNNANYAKRAKHLATTAKCSHPWHYQHDEIGYNYRLPNINAALGVAQLQSLQHFVELKRTLAARYQNAFAGNSYVDCFAEADFARSNYWLNALLLKQADQNLHEAILARAHAAKVLLRPAWQPLHTLNIYQHSPHMDLTCTEDLAQRIINLPSSPHLTEVNHGNS